MLTPIKPLLMVSTKKGSCRCEAQPSHVYVSIPSILNVGTSTSHGLTCAFLSFSSKKDLVSSSVLVNQTFSVLEYSLQDCSGMFFIYAYKVIFFFTQSILLG